MDIEIFSSSARKIREEVTEGMETLGSVYHTIKGLLTEDYDTGIFPEEYCKLTEQEKETVLKSRESEGKSFYFCKGCGSVNCIGYPPGYDMLSQEEKKQVNEWKEYIRKLDEKRGVDWENDVL
jgi:hypothetical protein